MKKISKGEEALVQEVQQLTTQVEAATIALAKVLTKTGPVQIDDDEMTSEIPDNLIIQMVRDEDTNIWTLYVEEVDELV